MKLTRILALFLALITVVFTLSSCISLPQNLIDLFEDETEAPPANEEKIPTDLDYILEKGTLLVGITDYEPMNYIDNSGEWAGFDTEFAYLVADELGVEVEFVIIEWEDKWSLLADKKIDCVWNGMTYTEEAEANASCTDTYVRNAQVVVVNEKNADKYTNAQSLADAKVAVEAGSAGRNVAKTAGLWYNEVPYQTDALSAVKEGYADACVVDITIATAMTGKDKPYPTLTSAFSLSEEEYAIACRKDSDLTERINEIMADLIADGSLSKIAQKYELTLVADVK